MGRTCRAIALGSITAITLLFGIAGPARAADITAATGGSYTFVGGPFVQAQGGSSTFVNPADSTFHNVTSAQFGPDGEALFQSETIPKGTSAPVAGVQYLTAGTYPFVCTLHTGMDGDLVVDSSGAPVARPGLKLSLPGQKLKQVRKSGKVKFKATALGETSGVTVILKSGKKMLASVKLPKLAAGASRTFTARLTNAGRKAIKNGKKVKFELSASIPFGKPVKASRTIR